MGGASFPTSSGREALPFFEVYWQPGPEWETFPFPRAAGGRHFHSLMAIGSQGPKGRRFTSSGWEAFPFFDGCWQPKPEWEAFPFPASSGREAFPFFDGYWQPGPEWEAFPFPRAAGGRHFHYFDGCWQPGPEWEAFPSPRAAGGRHFHSLVATGSKGPSGRRFLSHEQQAGGISIL